MLKRIYVHNYRTLVNFEWKIPASCALVGENGAGKSALVEVLWLLQDVATAGKFFEETGFPSTRTEWLNESEQTIEVDVDYGGESFRYRLGYRQEGASGSIQEQLSSAGAVLYRSANGKVELFGDTPDTTPRATIPFDRRRSFLAALEPRHDNKRITTFKESLSSIWCIKPDPRRLGAIAGAESNWLERDLSNFASWYRARVQEDPDAMEALRKDLHKAINGFDQLRFEPISSEGRDLRIRFAYGEKTHELGWGKLSDGQRLIIALYGVFRFAFAKANVVALDEIENYVAPSEIQPWLRAVADHAAEQNRQLLVISHHPESIDYMAADAVWRMWRDPIAGHSRIEKLEPDLDAGETAYDLLKRGPNG